MYVAAYLKAKIQNYPKRHRQADLPPGSPVEHNASVRRTSPLALSAGANYNYLQKMPSHPRHHQQPSQSEVPCETP